MSENNSIKSLVKADGQCSQEKKSKFKGGRSSSRNSRTLSSNKPASWVARDTLNEERHKGSYNIEILKQSPEYLQSRTLAAGGDSHNEGLNKTNNEVVTATSAAKRKYALCFGYLGSCYQGLQINPDADTIEKELEKALFLSDAISEANFGYMHKINWTRAARTDKGVHASAQCVAAKLLLPLESIERKEMIKKINEFLPQDIHLHTITKTSKAFNAYTHCTKRRYHYLLPTYLLINEKEINHHLSTAMQLQGPILGAGYEGGFIDPNSSKSLTRESLITIRREHCMKYRITSEILDALRSALQVYNGTRSYHNFTSGKHPEDANAQRYILSFECSEAFLFEETGVEWIMLSVLGQSFLIHQIRKMVGMAVEVARKATSLTTIHDAFTSRKMDLPMAPALGLYLDELQFEGYNIKQKKQILEAQRIAMKRSVETNDMKNNKEQVGEKRKRNEEMGSDSNAAADAVAVADDDDDDSNTAMLQHDQQQQQHEMIDWFEQKESLKEIHQFRDNFIHPHICREEASSLQFMYYLDYLRACPHRYDEMTKPFHSKNGNNENN